MLNVSHSLRGGCLLSLCLLSCSLLSCSLLSCCLLSRCLLSRCLLGGRLLFGLHLCGRWSLSDRGLFLYLLWGLLSSILQRLFLFYGVFFWHLSRAYDVIGLCRRRSRLFAGGRARFFCGRGRLRGGGFWLSRHERFPKTSRQGRTQTLRLTQSNLRLYP